MLAIGRALMARPQGAAARRTVDGVGAHGDLADLQDHRRDQLAGHHGAARRAERAAGAEPLGPGLHPGDRRGHRGPAMRESCWQTTAFAPPTSAWPSLARVRERSRVRVRALGELARDDHRRAVPEQALVGGDADRGALDLTAGRLTLELPGQLADLRDGLGGDGLAEAGQPAGRVDRDPAADRSSRRCAAAARPRPSAHRPRCSYQSSSSAVDRS